MSLTNVYIHITIPQSRYETFISPPKIPHVLYSQFHPDLWQLLISLLFLGDFFPFQHIS